MENLMEHRLQNTSGLLRQDSLLNTSGCRNYQAPSYYHETWQECGLVVFQRRLLTRSYVDDILTSAVLPMLSCHSSAIYGKTTFVHISYDSPSNVFEGRMYFYGLPGHQTSR
ncbi:hypothetical protein TNCV_1567031 [Trichonephila clavipes]|nr:hypothetical protein TNCV_1567031 [Trichonephila clavipes]